LKIHKFGAMGSRAQNARSLGLSYVIIISVNATLERYQLIRDLGAGAMGRVSLAMQADTGELVAVKRLHEIVALSGGARLRREFRSLSQIKHENVVRVIELGEDGTTPFLVMEFVRGQDMSNWLGTRPSFADIARVFAGVADALSAVHAQGVIHRDLKPENIRITDQGDPKLMDFGLAKTLEGSVALTKAGAMVGTALYMSPEQCRGTQLDYRADLYALGAVLYWALTGQPPFLGDSIVQVIMQHLQQTPVPPRTHNPEIPEALEKICMTLLSKNPNDRPSSAQSVREALLRALETPTTAMSVAMSVAQPARADALLIAPLVGREAELAVLSALFEAGTDGLHAVIGDVGTGKTRLLRALAERAQNSGARLGFGEAVSNDPTPYGAIKRLIDSLEKHYRFIFDEVSPAAQTELARIASQFGRATAPDPGLPLEVARLRLFEAFTELLERISKLTVIAFENLHWADESTLALLAHALRAAPSARVIITYRVEDLPEGLSVPKGLPKPKKTVALGAMPDDQMQQFLRTLLGGDIESALETELIGHAGGNPWVLEERLKAMLESKAVKRRANVFEWNRSLTRLPESLSELLAHRLTALESGALEFARAASVLGRNFQFEDAKQMLELSDDTALDALETLIRARLVAEVPGGNGELFRFTHPSYVELLRSAIMRLKRKRLHAKAAQLLIRKNRAEPLEIAEHWHDAEDHAKAAPQAFSAGQMAQTAFAHPQAERAYRLTLEAIRHLEQLEVEDHRAAESQQLLAMQAKHHLAEVLSFTGQTAEAQTLWRDVIERTQSLPERANQIAELIAKAKVALVRLLRYSGAVETALEIIGEPQRGEPLYTRLCAELCTLFRGKDRTRARHYGLEALSIGKRENDSEGVTLALLSLASGDEPLERKIMLARLAVRIVERTQNHYLSAIANNELGAALYEAIRDEEAYTAWARAGTHARNIGDLQILVSVQANMALIQMQDTEFAEAQEVLEQNVQLMRRMNLTNLEKHATFNIALCEYAQSRLEQARTRLAAVQEHDAAPMARVWEARITLELGDGFVTALPEIPEGALGHGVYRLTQAQMALSFGDHQKAWALTAQPNADADWHWALVRVHAGWRLGQRDEAALTQVMSGQAMNPTLTPDLMRQYGLFVQLIFKSSNEQTEAQSQGQYQTQLREVARQHLASPIGLLAREVLLSISE
jgi:tetratricopeptide (TPR) repeat protein